jgi:hypothetical protein
MEWAVKFFFKVAILVVAVWIGFSFVRQLFAPVERPVVLAGPSGGGRLPEPLPKAGIPGKPEGTRPANPAPSPAGTTPTPAASPAAGGVQPSGGVMPLPPPPPTDTSRPITEAIHDQILYRFLGANTQGNRLTIRLQVLNKGLDRMLEISSLPWSKTLFYNERSETYRPQDVQIANSRANAGKTRAMLVAGVPAEILLVYGELPMTVGSLSFRQVALMQLDVALFSTEQAYRNAFGDPIAVSRPTFRFLPITDGPVAAASGMQR